MSNVGFPPDIHTYEPPRPPTHEELYPEPPPRRARGGLEADIVRILEEIRAGEQPHPGTEFTPYRISRLVQARDDLAVRPSTGGVTDVLKRWVKVGACTCDANPYAFHAFTDAFYEHGLVELHRQHKAAKKAAKKRA